MFRIKSGSILSGDTEFLMLQFYRGSKIWCQRNCEIVHDGKCQNCGRNHYGQVGKITLVIAVA